MRAQAAAGRSLVCTMLAAGLVLGTAALLAPDAAAHGAQMKPPPSMGGDKPCFPTGAGKPGSSGGSTGKPAGSKPSTGAGAKAPAVGPAGAARGGVPTGAGAATRGVGGAPSTGFGEDRPMVPDIWEQWWFDNQDRLLGLRERLQTEGPSGTPRTPTGRDGEPSASRRASDAQVREQILPVLLELLSTEDETDVLDSALIALGRCSAGPDSGPALAAMRPFLAHHDASVQTSAVLALGIQGAAPAVPLLGAIMADEAAGRQAVGGGEVPPFLRALASLSLGMCNHPAAVPLLADLLERTPDGERDLKACTITALGLTENAATDEALGVLLARLQDRRLDAVLKAYVPLSLARLDGGQRLESGPAVLAAFADRDADDVVRTSCAIALGELASVRHADVLAALRDGLDDRNARTRHAAFLALAAIAARDRLPAGATEAFHDELAETLGRSLRAPRSNADRPWAALATGLYLRGGGPHHDVLAEILLAEHAALNDVSVRSAFAIGLGLAGVREASPALRADVRDAGDEALRGYAALALGLLGDAKAEPELLATCGDKSTSPTLRGQLGLALALLGSRAAAATLVETLETHDTHDVAVSVARTLGRIGDAQALPSLARLARDTGRTALTRGMACVALGLLGERTALPWNARLRATHNGDARVEAIEYVLDIL